MKLKCQICYDSYCKKINTCSTCKHSICNNCVIKTSYLQFINNTSDDTDDKDIKAGRLCAFCRCKTYRTLTTDPVCYTLLKNDIMEKRQTEEDYDEMLSELQNAIGNLNSEYEEEEDDEEEDDEDPLYMIRKSLIILDDFKESFESLGKTIVDMCNQQTKYKKELSDSKSDYTNLLYKNMELLQEIERLKNI